MAFYPIKVNGTRVMVTLTATTGWVFTFAHECEHAGWAELLARLEPEIAPSAAAVRAELGLSKAG